VPSSYNANALTSITATGQAAQRAWCRCILNGANCLYRNIRTDIERHSAFLEKTLPTFARENPQIEIRVSPRPQKHPLIKGLYINGREKPVCVRNMEPHEILKKANLLKEASGEKLKRVKKPVTSLNESVRGIWSPYHGDLRGV
jgi:large subunit ribosomal protein L43